MDDHKHGLHLAVIITMAFVVISGLRKTGSSQQMNPLDMTAAGHMHMTQHYIGAVDGH